MLWLRDGLLAGLVRGAEEGEEVTIKLPAGARQYKIVELSTLPQQTEARGS